MDKKIADDIAEAFHEGYRGGYQAGYERGYANGKTDADCERADGKSEWEHKVISGKDYYHCAECNGYTTEPTPFCPYCGDGKGVDLMEYQMNRCGIMFDAKMDGEVSEDV